MTITFFTETTSKVLEVNNDMFKKVKGLIKQAIDSDAKWLSLNFPDIDSTLDIRIDRITSIEYDGR